MDETNKVDNTHVDAQIQTTETPAAGQAQDKVFEVNGTKYTPADFDKAMKDYQNLTQHVGKLSSELGELRKTGKPAEQTPAAPAPSDLTPEQIAQTKKVLKEQFGLVDKDELNQREYAAKADEQIKAIAKKYGITEDDLGKELLEVGVKLPVEKFETVYKINHPEEFEKWRQAQIAADKPTTPYTQRVNKEGIELPSEPKPRFGENLVDMALELIGQHGE